ncbi:MAG: hypothetical protein ACR2G2_19415 [Pseudonocardia sp.]
MNGGGTNVWNSPWYSGASPVRRHCQDSRNTSRYSLTRLSALVGAVSWKAVPLAISNGPRLADTASPVPQLRPLGDLRGQRVHGNGLR